MYDAIKTEYLSRLSGHLRRRGMTQEQLGEVIGYSGAGVSSLLSGKTPLKIETLYEICDTLEINAPALLKESELAARHTLMIAETMEDSCP